MAKQRKMAMAGRLVILCGCWLLVVGIGIPTFDVNAGCDDCCTTAGCTDCPDCFCGPPVTFIVQPPVFPESLFLLAGIIPINKQECAVEDLFCRLERPPRSVSL